MLEHSVNQCFVAAGDHRQQVGVENLHGLSRVPCVNEVDITDNKAVEGGYIQLIGVLHHS